MATHDNSSRPRGYKKVSQSLPEQECNEVAKETTSNDANGGENGEECENKGKCVRTRVGVVIAVFCLLVGSGIGFGVGYEINKYLDKCQSMDGHEHAAAVESLSGSRMRQHLQ